LSEASIVTASLVSSIEGKEECGVIERDKAIEELVDH
jgi:hypothetical protein